jgi:general stress protein 26
MDEEQRKKLQELFRGQHVLVIATLGDDWPTTTMQAFAETEDLNIIVIMSEGAEKYRNLSRNSKVTVHVDTRDKGLEGFQVGRASIRGVAREVPKDSKEWDELKALFLRKNPFEEPFFGNPSIRMISIAPKWIEYAHGLGDAFTATL